MSYINGFVLTISTNQWIAYFKLTFELLAENRKRFNRITMREYCQSAMCYLSMDLSQQPLQTNRKLFQISKSFLNYWSKKIFKWLVRPEASIFIKKKSYALYIISFGTAFLLSFESNSSLWYIIKQALNCKLYNNVKIFFPISSSLSKAAENLFL